MIYKKTITSVFLLTLIFAGSAVLFSKTTTVTTVEVVFEWYYIHYEKTHDWIGKGEFYLKIRWKEDNVYQYYEFDVVQLAAEENDYPDQWYVFDADYPGTVDVQLLDEDSGEDDLIIDWRSTTIPSGSTFSWKYESPPGGCYIRIDIDNNS